MPPDKTARCNVRNSSPARSFGVNWQPAVNDDSSTCIEQLDRAFAVAGPELLVVDRPKPPANAPNTAADFVMLLCRVDNVDGLATAIGQDVSSSPDRHN
jgi:hypothetical protein